MTSLFNLCGLNSRERYELSAQILEERKLAESNKLRGELQAAMVKHYDAAREALAREGLFGEKLDRKARKLALEWSGCTLPEGATIAFATPTDWSRTWSR